MFHNFITEIEQKAAVIYRDIENLLLLFVPYYFLKILTLALNTPLQFLRILSQFCASLTGKAKNLNLLDSKLFSHFFQNLLFSGHKDENFAGLIC